ncbi:MAG: flagellar biosynthesis protein FlhF [Proteobacteria bacterium]|nr:flagellar biosynthesis protein FlhF [Pseudomonadota bacterium]
MRVKKYIANDMQEAVKMIKEEMGSKAIIISTKKVKKGTGAFGLFGKPVLEVTAAKDEKSLPKTSDSSQYDGLLLKQNLVDKNYQNEISKNAPAAPRSVKGERNTGAQSAIREDINELKDIVLDLRKGFRREINDEATITHLRYEMSELKNLVSTLVTQSGELRAGDLHENLIALFQQMSFNGVEEKFARRLVEEVQRKIPKVEINNFAYVKVYVARMFMQVLNINPSPTKKDSKFGPKVLTFLGPTGVGKTTTLAKIAGSEKLNNPDIKIGLITMDTFRIAAVSQLKEYARIIRAPISVVNTPEELNKAVEGFRDKDLVLIDTAGRSQRDELQMAELREYLSDTEDFQNILVLSATTKDSDLVEITKRFSTTPLAGVAFTKLDESTNYGSIFNHSIRFKLPITYLTTGQNVPEDIEGASRERLIDLLLNISGD